VLLVKHAHQVHASDPVDLWLQGPPEGGVRKEVRKGSEGVREGVRGRAPCAAHTHQVHAGDPVDLRLQGPAEKTLCTLE
jgi:hypothetical protein